MPCSAGGITLTLGRCACEAQDREVSDKVQVAADLVDVMNALLPDPPASELEVGAAGDTDAPPSPHAAGSGLEETPWQAGVALPLCRRLQDVKAWRAADVMCARAMAAQPCPSTQLEHARVLYVVGAPDAPAASLTRVLRSCLPPEPSASATASTTVTMCVVSWLRPDVCFANPVCLQITTTRSLFARATKALARAEELDRDVARGSPSLAKCAPFPDSVAQEYAQVYYHFGLALCMKFHTLECARMLGASAMAPCSVFVGGHSRWCDHRQGTNPWP